MEIGSNILSRHYLMVSSDSDTAAGFMLVSGKSLIFTCINKHRGEIADNYWHLMGVTVAKGTD